jgi:hypothetical protein
MEEGYTTDVSGSAMIRSLQAHDPAARQREDHGVVDV